MKKIYLDNGATSFPKPKCVGEAVLNYINNLGTSINRGAYETAYSVADTVFETRELICELFNFDQPENVVFTKNITESLNLLIKGLLKEGDHVVVSSMEHNAVMRPLNSLNVKVSKTECNKYGDLDIEDFKSKLKKNTRAVIMTHASNVCGTILNLEEVGRICQEKNIFFIVDTAQTAGFLDIDYKKLKADAIAFTGHKSLLGPQGIGGFIINDRLVEIIPSLIDGGTGSLSEEERQPCYMPDKYEAGTPNIPGIFGLNASIKYLKNTGLENIRQKEYELLKLFLDEIKEINGIAVVGKDTPQGRTGAVSLDFFNHDNGEIAYKLGNDYGIMTRSGMHCAPGAHKTLGTFPRGTVRFSFSHFNTKDEIYYAMESIKKIMEE
ncbi:MULTISPECIES: aminotransferase class V-fold PLP-dependent enzyme [Psychrilyobacter]|uniref:Aminotransferase class V-fold PLP-dependent enzyme n=1 Tax=Psychrilyobacter piezotolerans TaxID=2293438 RepID=A0ABX9KCS1_9FUSO|nr:MULTISPECIES: aminotransferase class V-fold PLP-dependent enzyme [Psychrilyobacter]MCS5423231.1 aminotransferase class V-fold PLP-dependent enzyme [Psychrilyobacter sp. S5]NDI79134.1 aminotransferase class V-fold PLP-dependent enzyme [Psychrilyobacter piezotolerans]RDE58764.1 aminotransferase class V-fold PLP-dependent enzyme [Psychrilyobacter sp. S5]REI39237.1 aminotransferase class V-fold PLP-dependent enzyme [Psychrilyobacter piezotolerans]